MTPPKHHAAAFVQAISQLLLPALNGEIKDPAEFEALSYNLTEAWSHGYNDGGTSPQCKITFDLLFAVDKAARDFTKLAGVKFPPPEEYDDYDGPA